MLLFTVACMSPPIQEIGSASRAHGYGLLAEPMLISIKLHTFSLLPSEDVTSPQSLSLVELRTPMSTDEL